MARKQADNANQDIGSAPGKNSKPDANKGAGRADANKGKERHQSKRPNPVTRFIRYVEASRAELRKVTWPGVKETRKATIAVLCFVGIMAILLGLIDLGLSSLIKTILS